ncbi:alpha/beta hydrolase [Micromonospora sp. WMMC241]|uniref:alpha/beta hydrolase n=1 Tax=Micromonospora sp. WMMC241 TaxID=3015159 RepID=UPI0022B63AC1|nr:alpha/beta hydrolase [Micromonospora sp. WMMC241]MCZ7438788.1 alpha/beta hydrolase [Micromonospora sp. WMMC241]
MLRRRGVALVGTLGLAGALVTVIPAMAEESAAPRSAAGPQWTACPKDVVVPPTVQLPVQCAKVPVPLDYDDPDGTQIEIMVSRIASTKPEKRRGVLMFNPGGPGGTGLDQPAFLVSKGLPTGVTDAYDLIGMDTRGVGHSTPVSCGFTADDAYWANIPPYAPDDAAVTRQAEIAEDVAERCAANDTEGRLRHLSTANMARDLDRIRAALGEEKASFYGASYGSALGAAYASMFPATTDRVVLDSIVGDTHLDRAGLRRFALGMEQTFPDFAKWAAARHESYGLGRTPQQVRRTYLTLAERLDENPAPDGMTGPLFRQVTFGSLYNEIQYANLARLWQTYLNPGEAPQAKAAAAPNPQDNALTVFLAVTCNDVEWPEDVDTYRRAVAQDRKRFPLFGAASANITPCAFWTHDPAGPPVAVNDRGPRNVLILQNRHDPVTPLAGGKLLREKFDKRSRLVTVDGSGHGVYVLGGNACALNVTTSYLVDGAMPAGDRNCRRG